MIRADNRWGAASCEAGGAACLSVLTDIDFFRALMRAKAAQCMLPALLRETSRSTAIRFGKHEPWEPMPFY